MATWSPVKDNTEFYLGCSPILIPGGNVTNGEITFLYVDNLMSNSFRIYMGKIAPDITLQIPSPDPLFLPYVNNQFHYVQNHSLDKAKGEVYPIQGNGRLSSSSNRNEMD